MPIQLAYPIRKTHENIALRPDGTAVAFYRIPNTSITVTDSKRKEQHKKKVNRVLLKLQKQKNIELSLIPKDYLLEEKMRDFSAALAEDSKKEGLQYLNKIVTDLTDEMEIPYQYDWLIGIDVRKNLEELSLANFVVNKTNEVASSLAGLAGYEVPLKDNWYVAFENDEQAVFQILHTLKAKRLSDEDLFYYQRMQYLRYVPHLKEEVIASRSLMNVTDTVITVEKGGYLKLENAYGVSYVDILPIGKLPTIYNGFHVAEFVQRFSFPVELKVQGEFIDNNSIKGTMARSNVRYLNIMTEAKMSNTVQQEEIILGNMSLKDLMKRVGKKESLIEFSANLIISASSVESLRKRRMTLLNYFEDLKVGVYEAKFDTPYLFQTTLMGQRLTRTKKFWNHLTLTKGLAEFMLFTNTFSGNRIGWYIGRVDNNLNQWDSLQRAVHSSKNLVLFNATVGNKEDVDGKQTKNPHFAITGATGEGKSYLAELIFLLVSFLNVRLLYVDPKRSIRKHWEDKINLPDFQRKYPHMVKHVKNFNFVTLDSKEESNKGVLDPIVILSPKDAISTAKNIIFYLLRDEKLELTQKTAIGETITKVVDKREAGEIVGFNTVISLLKQDERKQIFELGEYLQSIVISSILELAFSDGDVEGLSYDKRVTVLEVADLSLPKSSQNNEQVKLSDHEQKSIALMFALGAFCRRFGERNKDEDTIEFFDEAWVLMSSSEGKEIIKNMKRIGRYYNNTLGLITQSVEDTTDEEDGTGFGTLFAFKQPTELPAILKHVGLEDNNKNIEWLSNMISGQCLYKDVYGNLNMITVHTLFEDIDELLKPMKPTVSSNLENKYAG